MRVLLGSDLRTGLVLGSSVILESGEVIDKNSILTDKLIEKIQNELASDTPVFIYDIKELEPKLVKDDSLTRSYVDYISSQFRHLFLTSISDADSFDSLNRVMRSYFYKNRSVLTETILLRDDHLYTFEHSVNVAMLSAMVGLDLGISDNELYTLIVGSLLHDIGKIRVSNKILDKPDRLTDSEFRSIKNHTIYGVEMSLSLESVNDEIRKIIRQHHEKLDGSGYPDGLSDVEISPLSKIVTVSDMFDAVSSDRAYHSAKSTYKSMEVLNEASFGGKIDKTVVDSLRRNITLYPTGAILTLSDGRIVTVVTPDSKDNRPVVYDVITKEIIDLSQKPSLLIIDAI